MGTRIKQVKDFGARQAARLITEMLPRISDEKLSALVRLGLWLSNDQVTINQHGECTRRLYAEWTIPREEYENEG